MSHDCDTPPVRYPGMLPPAPWTCPDCGDTWRFRVGEQMVMEPSHGWETPFLEGEWVRGED